MNRTNLQRRLLLLLLLCPIGALWQQSLAAQEAAPPRPEPAVVANFDGLWDTTFGLVKLKHEKDRVTGVYADDEGTLSGSVEGNRLRFSYREPEDSGTGYFELASDGKSFRGKFKAEGTDVELPWNGTRVAPAPMAAELTFDGLWNSSFGKLRLIQHENQVTGVYAYGGGSTLKGKVENKRLTFRYQEANAGGEGWFELSPDGRGFQGEWKQDGHSGFSKWEGTRVPPTPGRRWLVVLEAHFENSLTEQEYSFGQMLKTFFARVPAVEVRHRFFHDRRDLRHFCEELAYLNEPAVLVIASHGTPNGVSVNGETIHADAFAEGLQYARNVQLLHFSACQIMAGDLPRELHERLAGASRIPISGYTTVVDWATSAVLEFMYLDLVLSRRLPPADAARQLERMMPIAGDARIADIALPSAGFRIRLPQVASNGKPPAPKSNAANENPLPVRQR